MSEDVEYAEVTLKVPKRIMDFLEDMKQYLKEAHGFRAADPSKEYLEREIIGAVLSDIDGGLFSEVSSQYLIRKYGLESFSDL